MNDALNDRPATSPELLALATICNEAAQRYGDDWPAVERHIKKRVNALPTDQRKRLAHEMDRVLRYRAPDQGALTQ
jgi:hypothetical protein